MGEQWVSRLLILSLHIWLAWRKADAMMTIKELGRARQGVMCSTTNVQKTKQNNHQPFINVKFLFCFTQEIGPTQHLLQQQQKRKRKQKVKVNKLVDLSLWMTGEWERTEATAIHNMQDESEHYNTHNAVHFVTPGESLGKRNAHKMGWKQRIRLHSMYST